MNHLLKGKKVFLDTTEFSDRSFNFNNPSFAEFQKLCKSGELILLTTEITKREIQQGIKVLADRSVQAIKSAHDAIHSLQLPEVESLSSLTKKLKPTDFAQSWQTGVDKFFDECGAITIPMPSGIIEKVFDLYFERRPPFGGGDKKAEFPDAFVLQALETVRLSNDEILYVVSKDKDFESACAENSDWEHLKSLDYLLNIAQRHTARIKQIRDTIDANFSTIEKRLEIILKSLSPELRGSEGSVQLNSIEISDILDILIVSSEKNAASVTFVCLVEIDAMLELFTIPDEPSCYKGGKKAEVIHITLEFSFDPKDKTKFEAKTYWAPETLIFEAGQNDWN